MATPSFDPTPEHVSQSIQLMEEQFTSRTVNRLVERLSDQDTPVRSRDVIGTGAAFTVMGGFYLDKLDGFMPPGWAESSWVQMPGVMMVIVGGYTVAMGGISAVKNLRQRHGEQTAD